MIFKHSVTFELLGRFAHFNDPHSGSSNISLPFPPPSQVRGILNKIYNIQNVTIRVNKIGIVRIGSRQYITTNSESHLGKKDKIFQRKIEVLCDVHYYLDVALGFEYHKMISKSDFVRRTKDPAHAMVDILRRRIRRREFEQIPCLGVREFEMDDIYLSTECPETKNVNGEWQVVKRMFPLNKSYPTANPEWTTAFVNEGIVTFRE